MNTKTMFTLGRLVKATGLARSSLLHYESLGLLPAARRSAAGYRLYDEGGLERVRTIQRYREAGLSLAAIAEILSPKTTRGRKATSRPVELLEKRLLGLSEDISRLRRQQRQLATILAAPAFRGGGRPVDKAGWTEMLRKAGFSDDDMTRWHADFERDAPEDHRTFLESLGLARPEVRAIRRWSKAWKPAGPRESSV